MSDEAVIQCFLHSKYKYWTFRKETRL